MLRTGCTKLSPSGRYGFQRPLRPIEVDGVEGRNSAAYTVVTNTFQKPLFHRGLHAGSQPLSRPAAHSRAAKDSTSSPDLGKSRRQPEWRPPAFAQVVLYHTLDAGSCNQVMTLFELGRRPGSASVPTTNRLGVMDAGVDLSLVAKEEESHAKGDYCDCPKGR